MAPKDRKALAACLLAAGELYGKPVSDAVAEVWWRALQPYDAEAVTAAFDRHFTSPDSGQYMPKPADIIRMIDGSSEDSALIAWAKVDRAMRSVGTYMSVVFDDALIHRVLHDMGGWIGLGQRTNDDWPFVANEFVKRYRGYRSTRQAPAFPSRLIGLHEAHNVTSGYPEAVPVAFLGDQVRAQQVRLAGAEMPRIGVTQEARDFMDKAALELAAGAMPDAVTH